MHIVAFGTYQSDTHPRIGVLIEGLRTFGHEVTELNAPLGLSTAQRVSMLKGPWRVPVLAAKLVRRWWALGRRAGALRRGRRVDAVLVGYLGHFDVHLARRVFKGSTVVLDHLIFAAGTAVDRGVRTGVTTRVLGQLDARALSAADVIVVDTDEHRARVPERFAARAVVCLVGADAGWFRAAERATPDPAPGEPVRVVFFGLYTPLQGAETIGGALRALAAGGTTGAELAVTMIGTGQDLDATRRAAGPGSDPLVTWLDWVDSAELPAVVAGHHVALGIFGTTTKAAEVVPNKVYQSAAAGCAVITSDTLPQRRVLAGAATLVRAGDADALADALRELIDNRELLAARRRACADLAQAEFSAVGVVRPLADRLSP